MARTFYNPYERDAVSVDNTGNGSRLIKQINLDLSDLSSNGETRNFTITGDNNAEFRLEVKNSNNYYYNFTTKTFVATQSDLEITMLNGSYSNSIVFPDIKTTDTVNGAVSSGVKVVMDTVVANTMSVGDKVTGNAFLNANHVTVAALNPDGDNTS